MTRLATKISIHTAPADIVSKRTGMGEYHGSAADRGAADSWYRRPKDPHYWPNGSYKGERVDAKDMVQAELDAYDRAYDENEAEDNHKE